MFSWGYYTGRQNESKRYFGLLFPPVIFVVPMPAIIDLNIQKPSHNLKMGLKSRMISSGSPMGMKIKISSRIPPRPSLTLNL
jgi:hypothetical protein